MHTLNLIDPAQSDIKFQLITFPDGQPHIKIDMQNLQQENTVCRILTRISSPADLILVLFAKNTLEHLGFEKIELYISYLLAARMDRVMNEGEPFSLKVIAAVLNNAGFNKIKIFDPHSEVATALLDKSYAIDNINFVKDVLQDYKAKNLTAGESKFCIVSPDAGALKKIYKVAAALNNIHVVECMKSRDVKTGSLTGFEVFEKDLTGKICFIVDDICDGGGTFIGVANELKKLGTEKIILVVSHGIFSKGFDLQNVDEIYCTDSYKEIVKDVKSVNVISVLKYLL
ncbi:MAG: ribose-phosphate pyrophosphokinase [Chitinophagaceae bacterium]|nr:ribose-phosphate pyrophosphokinase [Chitinophagaceae bacterium]